MADRRHDLEPLLGRLLAQDAEGDARVRHRCEAALRERSLLLAEALDGDDVRALHEAVQARARLALDTSGAPAPQERAPLRWVARTAAAILLVGLLLPLVASMPPTDVSPVPGVPPNAQDAGPSSPAPHRALERVVTVPRAQRRVRTVSGAVARAAPQTVRRVEPRAWRPVPTRPRLLVVRRTPARYAGPERIDDQRLLALFPDRPRAILQTADGPRLVFLDEGRTGER